ncbi:glycosyltransferase [Fimbriiglobus ruber]|uniref:Glycosyl transferase group 1 n=1 Tax=Fimbriiglobus ruber TaxID=1908690 RepID=A0A225DX77_9BACT|nr:glycosyltransferase [Fimbriiglobus ruber]OWK40767.1 glycosyl transferase group 1 [Fimbriiglobus ruber]
MRIGFAIPTLVDGDAVGNDLLGMARILRRRGHDVLFFAWNSRINEPVKGPADLPRMLNSPDDVLIYHHSIGCEWAVKAVETLPCRRKAVKYHNVTPPEFFAKLNAEVAAGCAQGIAEVSRLAKTGAHIWADSEFNARHVREVCPGRAVAELPPFHQADDLFAAEPDFRAANGLDDWNTNILLVGRLVPNKNIPLAVRAFADYRARFDPRARLIVVGDRPVPEHAAEVDAEIHASGQAAHTVVTGKVTLSQLKALYLTADALLVTSLHEGFCVPLIEAMGLRLPVVAVPNAAVPFTGGDAARYAGSDPAAIADQLAAVINDRVSREAQIVRGWDRYAATFSNDVIGQKFETLFDELMV